MDFELIVIGAGPGGYVCAIRAAQLGMKVCCIDNRATLGGTCLNIGCIPSKALLESSHLYHQTRTDLAEHGIICSDATLNLPKMMHRKEKVVSKLVKGIDYLMGNNKITVKQAHASFADNTQTIKLDNGQQITGKNIVIATGSEPIAIDVAPFDGQRIVSSTEALSFNEVPKQLAVIGGGVIGLEMASIWKRLGSEVFIIEARDRLLAELDEDFSRTCTDIFANQGIKFYLGQTVTATTIEEGQVQLTLNDQQLTVDKVLVAVGRRANSDNLGLEKVGIQRQANGMIVVNQQLQTTADHVYAIGDVVPGAMLAHKAEEEGVAVAEHLAGGVGHVNYQAIPSVIYTFPEIATVGLTTKQAKQQGFDIKTGKFPFTANGRALASGYHQGLIKIIADRQSDQLLGAQLVGPQVSEIIAELVLAIEYQASSEDLARTVHAHPTLAEVIKEAALACDGRAIHS